MIVGARRIGSAGAPTFPSASGARCARTTRANGECWGYFPHDHARSRAYRWGEDGLLGLCDRECRLCFALALWNGKDPILKERLFGLTNPEGNHGEDVKECYFYLDATPTHSYAKALYKYPQADVPLRAAGRGEPPPRRATSASSSWPTPGVFDEGRYFDVIVEYAKAGARRHPDPHHRRQPRARGRAAAPAADALVPQHLVLGLHARGMLRPSRAIATAVGDGGRGAEPRLARATFRFDVEPAPERPTRELLFTENETNASACSASRNAVALRQGRVPRLRRRRARGGGEPARVGHQVRGATTVLDVPARRRARRCACGSCRASQAPADGVRRRLRRGLRRSAAREADEFYAHLAIPPRSTDERRVVRQAYAGLLWSKQFYHYVVQRLAGGRSRPAGAAAAAPARPQRRLAPPLQPRRHLDARQVGVPLVRRLGPGVPHDAVSPRVDPQFAKEQLMLLLREWYMHPNGQIPAYEFAFSRRQPAGARLGRAGASTRSPRRRGQRDRVFLARVFQKLLINFTWWVNRKDVDGQQSLRRRLPRPRQHRRLRPLEAAARRRPARAGRRHRLDGVLLHAPCWRWRSSWPRPIRPTRTSPRSSSSTSSPSPTP